jgi:spermidine synthase
MSASYEELDCRKTAIGDLILRRRCPPGFGDLQVYEIMLGHDLLMSSYLTESERQLAHLGLAAVESADRGLEVLIGGLGLGYTTEAALEDTRVRAVTVIEFLPEVIEWHAAGRVPLGHSLTTDARVRIEQGDFFGRLAALRADQTPGDGYDAILVDIDHAPDERLHELHGGFYRERSLRHVATLLRAGGVFAFWSAGDPQDAFTTLLQQAFPHVASHRVEVYNPMIDEDQVDTIYVARRGP